MWHEGNAGHKEHVSQQHAPCKDSKLGWWEGEGMRGLGGGGGCTLCMQFWIPLFISLAMMLELMHPFTLFQDVSYGFSLK